MNRGHEISEPSSQPLYRKESGASNWIHVVAGVLSDGEGRVLVAQRPVGKHFAGAWEFPGGKLDPGETPHAALRRELREELGIEIGAIEPLIGVPWAYAEKSIFLDVYHVLDYADAPRALDAQALAWHRPDDLVHLDMPPPDRPVVTALRLPHEYAITPEPDDNDEAFLQRVSHALAQGVRMLQFRAKTISHDHRLRLALALRELTVAYGARMLVNGDMQLTLDCRADGVHLQANQLMLCDRPALPASKWVAVSCHNSHELALAAAIGVDFVVLGPVCATLSHPEAETLGWKNFAELARAAPLPIYALGGLARGDVTIAREHGAQGVAGISAFFEI